MNTTTVVKAFFHVTQEDLRRFGIQLAQDDDGRPQFIITYLSNRMGDIENYRAMRDMIVKIFSVPAKVIYHSEDTTKEQAEEGNVQKDLHIEERTFNGDPLAVPQQGGVGNV